MSFMRAKLIVASVTPTKNGEGVTVSEQVTLFGVAKSAYPADGSDEDNSFAKFTPAANLSLTVANPALIGKLEPGATFYVDFTPVEATPPQ